MLSYVLDWDFGLNNRISVLLTFNNILFAWGKYLVASSHDWCPYLSFSVICQAVVGLYHLQNDLHHYIWLLCGGHLCRRGTVKDPSKTRLRDSIVDICIFWRENIYCCVLLLSLQIRLEPLEFSSSYAIVIQFIK